MMKLHFMIHLYNVWILSTCPLGNKKYQDTCVHKSNNLWEMILEVERGNYSDWAVARTITLSNIDPLLLLTIPVNKSPLLLLELLLSANSGLVCSFILFFSAFYCAISFLVWPWFPKYIEWCPLGQRRHWCLKEVRTDNWLSRKNG